MLVPSCHGLINYVIWSHGWQSMVPVNSILEFQQTHHDDSLVSLQTYRLYCTLLLVLPIELWLSAWRMIVSVSFWAPEYLYFTQNFIVIADIGANPTIAWLLCVQWLYWETHQHRVCTRQTIETLRTVLQIVLATPGVYSVYWERNNALGQRRSIFCRLDIAQTCGNGCFNLSQ